LLPGRYSVLGIKLFLYLDPGKYLPPLKKTIKYEKVPFNDCSSLSNVRICHGAGTSFRAFQAPQDRSSSSQASSWTSQGCSSSPLE
jgi:hypothetical protein